MRAFETTSNNTYFHNGDFSGNISWEFFRNGRIEKASMPFEDMKELVAEYIKRKMISQLEEMSAQEVLEKFLEG